jgi:Carboxypeptidase regulatory-like domain/TonB dependent receptor
VVNSTLSLSLHVIRGRLWRAAFVFLITCASAAAQTGTATSYKGRPVSDVLHQFRRQGLNLVFSDALVQPSMRVTQEPRETTPRGILTEILTPHGLSLREEGRGALLVVKSTRDTVVQEQPTLPAPAEDGWIEGIVLDQATQRPISSAVILIDTTAAYAMTGDDGRFKIASVPAGVQTVRVEAAGYEPLSSPELKISPRRGTTVSVEMIPSPQFHEVVTVTAPADPRPPGVTTSSFGIANEEIRRSAGSLGDINRFVQSLPGLAAVGDVRNDLVTRGGSPVEGLIRVDGFETPTLSHFSTVGSAGGVVTLLNNELIADATFLAGGFPAEYGDRLSSVLDIRLREGNRTRHAFEADVNFAGASIGGEGPLGSRGSWIAAARRSYFDLIASAADVSSAPEMSAFTFKAVYDLGQRHKIWAVSVGGADSIDFNTNEEDPDEPDYIGIEQRAARVVVGLGWQHLLWKQAFGVFSVSSSTARYEIDVRDRQLGADDLILRDHSNENATIIQYDLSWQASPAWAIRGGTGVKSLWRGLDISQPRGMETPYSIQPRDETPGLTLDFETASPIASAYVQASGQLLPRTTLTGGIRLETFEALGNATAAGPRGGIETRLSPTVRISLSAGRYHQQPELVTVVAVPENANLAPIESDHLVAGVKYEPRPDLLVSAEVYRKWYRSYPSVCSIRS